MRDNALRSTDLVANQFSIVVSTDWRFTDGELNGKPVLPALAEYWNQDSRVLAKAQTLLGAWPPDVGWYIVIVIPSIVLIVSANERYPDTAAPRGAAPCPQVTM
jgi:hypothetical protein